MSKNHRAWGLEGPWYRKTKIKSLALDQVQNFHPRHPIQIPTAPTNHGPPPFGGSLGLATHRQVARTLDHLRRVGPVDRYARGESEVYHERRGDGNLPLPHLGVGDLSDSRYQKSCWEAGRATRCWEGATNSVKPAKGLPNNRSFSQPTETHDWGSSDPLDTNHLRRTPMATPWPLL